MSPLIVTEAQDSMDIKSYLFWTSLVIQWLRIHLSRERTQVGALLWEDPTCLGATNPCPQLLSLGSKACAPQLEKPPPLESSPCSPQLKKACA